MAEEMRLVYLLTMGIPILSKGCFLQLATARLKAVDCNHWILRQTNLPHQYGLGKAGGRKPY